MKPTYKPFVLLSGTFALLFFLLLAMNRVSYAAYEPQQPNSEQALGSISGKVTNEAGDPLPGIEVQIYNRSLPAELPEQLPGYPAPRRRITAVVDEDGIYRLPFLTPNTYVLEFRDPQALYANEFYSNAVSVDTSFGIQVAGTQVENINAIMALGGTISGTISTPSGVTLNDSVTIRLQDAEVPYEQGNSISLLELPAIASSYAFTNLTAGKYRVCATATITPAGYVQECYDDVAADVTDRAKPIKVQSGEVSPDVNFVLGQNQDYGTISGQVSDTEGNPLAGIQVSNSRTSSSLVSQVNAAEVQCFYDFRPIRAITDDEGRYSIPYAVSGVHSLSFEDKEIGLYLFSSYRDRLQPADPGRVLVEAGKVTSGIDGVMRLGGRIRGSYTLSENVEDPDLIEALLSKVAVRVADAAEPYRSCGFSNKVVLIQPNQYEARGLRNGRYVASASTSLNELYYGGHYHKTEPGADYGTPITLTAGEIRSGFDILLNGSGFSGVISGTVTANAQPLAGIRVDLNTRSSEPLIHTFTDDAGRYSFESLGAEEYQLGFIDPENIYATVYYSRSISSYEAIPIQMLNGTESITNIDVSLEVGAIITGTVTYLNGEPVANTSVTAYLVTPDDSQGRRSASGRTDEQGQYRIGLLMPGQYRVCTSDRLSEYQEICMDGERKPGRDREVVLVAGARMGNLRITLPSARWTDVIYLPSVAQ